MTLNPRLIQRKGKIMNNKDKLEGIKEALQLYEKPLLCFARQYVQSSQIAQDVVQDTFIKLCQADWQKVREKLKPWLFTVCRNRALEVIRKEKRMTALDDIKLQAQPAKGATPAAAMQKNDSLQLAMTFIKSLNSSEQELIKLKYQQQLSYKEISEVTGLTVSNVGVTLHSALKKLRFKINCLEVAK